VYLARFNVHFYLACTHPDYFQALFFPGTVTVTSNSLLGGYLPILIFIAFLA
jgi:hypothetical protein